MTEARRKLTIGYLYPSITSQYGDWGNLLCLLQRCRWRGIDVEVEELPRGSLVRQKSIDIFLMGGGADSHQRLIAQDFVQLKGNALREAIEEGVAALMVCAGYQLCGEYYRTYRGDDLPGLGILPAYTVHRAAQLRVPLDNVTKAGRVRAVDNLVVEWGSEVLVGFENHGGRTYLRPGAQPLGRVLVGSGNNSEDRTEGCVYRNAIGTYLHGPVLPKNPHLADHLIVTALRRRHGQVDLEPLPDELEMEAHRRAVARARETHHDGLMRVRTH